MTQSDAPATQQQGTWFSQLEPPEKRTFWGCFGGWALDAFDVQLYSLVLPVLLSTHFLANKSQGGLIATVALLSSAVGGWLAGVLSDRIGRVKTLQITVLWFSVFTALSGLAQDPTQLMIARGLMGFGFGGEWAAGAVLIGETVRPQFRGRAVGTVQSGWAIGWGVAVIAFLVVGSVAPQQWAWRILFFLGILPALLVLYLRRFVKDPELVDKTLHSSEAKQHSPLLAIFGPHIIKTTILCSLVAVGAQGGYYALTTWLPQFLAESRGLKVLSMGPPLGLVIAGAFIGYLFGAWLTDKIGRRMALILCSIGAVAVVLPFTLLKLPLVAFLVLCFPLGFFSSAYFSGIGAFFTEQFPTEFRGSGQGFSYNFGRGVGALFPFLVGALATKMHIGPAIAVFACVAYGVLALGALLLPETRGKDLATSDANR